jgi:hypothetical protein
MSRLCRLKSYTTIGEDGKWAYKEIVRLRARVAELEGQVVKGIPFTDGVKPLDLLIAASKSGSEEALYLATILAGVAPCEGCGYRKEFCRCLKTLDKDL